MTAPARAQASPPPVMRLWSGSAPLAQGTADKDTPSLTVFLPPATPDGKARSAVVICPGGGYWGESFVVEGLNVAAWYEQRNVAAFVLKYRTRLEGYHHPAAMLDGQRAIRFVRSHAAEWNLDPQKIGIMGFSAGGHLASTVETHYDAGNASAADPVDRVSCRPDFAVLCYAVISMKDGITHVGSRTNLIGEHPSPELIADLSNEMHVTAQTPPTYILYAANDALVPTANSKLMYAALQKAGVPSVIHEYPIGGHGFGLGRVPDPGPPGWIDAVGNWLKSLGFLS